MIGRLGRPVVAAVLALAAVGCPAVAWWLTGMAEVERQVEHLEEDARRALTDQAQVLASRLVGRLQSLRTAENARPFYHYTNPIHDADSDELVPSPLAMGSADPLVLAHFQVSPDLVLSMPTTRQAPDGRVHPLVEEQLALEARLREHAEGFAKPARTAGLVSRPGTSTVAHGPLRWREVGAPEPLLVASRYLATPDGTWVQGFIVNQEEVEAFLGTNLHPVRLSAGRVGLDGQAVLNLPGVTWRLAVDGSHSRAATASQARWIRSDFRRTFTLGVALALVAALALIGLVWQADRLARQRSTFAAVAAHELRTPLAGLRLHADLIAEGLGDPERTTLNARRIASEAERLGRVVRNVLDFSRLEQGTLALSPSGGDLKALVSDVVERMRAGVEAAGARIEVVSETDPTDARFDADAVTGILQNLIDNAVKYSSKAEDRLIEVTLDQDGPEILLSVRDRGPGIPDNLRTRLFGFFARGRDTGDVAGLGLGLALSARLARDQDGHLHADEVDEGASLTLRLPAA